MLTLASMVWAAWFYVATATNMLHDVPSPVVVQTGKEYKYNDIEAAIYVPLDWDDSCANQQQIVYYMALNFNNFRNGKKKFPDSKLHDIAAKWQCLTDQSK